MPVPPTIRLDEEFALDAWRAPDAVSHRMFAEEVAAARFLGWTVEDAQAQPHAHYRAVVRRFQDEWTAGTRFSLAVRRIATGEAVGAVEARPIGDAVEVSYLVGSASRGQGLAPRALDALLEWASRHLAVRRALLICHVENVASQRVAAKCGFTQTASDTDELRFARPL